MSKNFELMQQAGASQEFHPQPKPMRSVPLGNGNGHREKGALDLDEVASEEALRLVQRIFLLQAQEPPRAVVFAGVDHGNGCSRICVRVAETLAKNIRGSVCMVEANLRSPALPGQRRRAKVRFHHAD